MKILHKDLKHGIIKIKADNSEDLWYLESIIEPDDLISGMTERKIKIGGADEKSKISRVNVFVYVTPFLMSNKGVVSSISLYS